MKYLCNMLLKAKNEQIRYITLIGLSAAFEVVSSMIGVQVPRLAVAQRA